MTSMKMTKVASHLEGESLHKILTPIIICIVFIFITIEVWFMDMNRQVSDFVGLQQSFDLRRESFPLL